MDNQQETKLYKIYIIVGSSETMREAPLKISKGWKYSPALLERLGI